MIERIDHAAEARDWTDRGVKASTSDAESRCVAMAQVHATLALVEQQRIANRVALAGLGVDGPLRHLAVQPHGDFFVDVHPDIAAALGIEVESDE